MRPENAATQTNSNQPNQQERLQNLREMIELLRNAAMRDIDDLFSELIGGIDRLFAGLTDEEKIQMLTADNSEALKLAADRGNLEVVNGLIEVAGELPNGQNILTQMLTADNDNYSALAQAAGRGHLEVVNRLIEAARKLPNGQNVLAQMLSASNYNSALEGAAGGGHLEVVNRLIEAARGLLDRNGQNVLAQMLINSDALRDAGVYGMLNVVNRLIEVAGELPNGQNVLAQMLTNSNDLVLRAARYDNFNIVDRLFEAAEVIQDEAVRRAFRDRANQEMRERVVGLIGDNIGDGNRLDLNINGENENIYGSYNPENRDLLRLLTSLSNLPENLEDNQNRPIGRNDLINSITQQLPENNPLRRFLGAFEEIFRNPAFPNLENGQDQITRQKLPIISSLFDGHNQRPMIEQMKGGWSELRELETIINDVEGFGFSNKKIFKDLSEAKKARNGNLGEKDFISKIPADITRNVVSFLTGDVDPNIVPAVFDLAKSSNNFINLLAIAEMANSPDQDLTLENVNQIIAQRDLRVAQRDSAETIEPIRSVFEEENQKQANNNPNQEQIPNTEIAVRGNVSSLAGPVNQNTR